MKHIKTYEDINTKLPKKGDFIIAYRPKNNYDKDIVMFNSKECVIDCGKVLEVINSSGKGVVYYDVIFNGGHYYRTINHILYIADNEQDAEENMILIKKANKYNL